MQSAVIEAQQRAEELAKYNATSSADDDLGVGPTPTPVVETNGAIVKDGKVYLRGNPLKTTKKLLCPNCKLPRLLYPRVGYGARDPPDSRQQYCKNEPAIIIDKHDVHGQRKKGTKLKGPGKGKQKKNDAASPGSSNPSAPSTPLTASFPAETFEFKTIEAPAAKCPNRDSALGDHWKTVTQMATHLNGNCFLKRDRAAGREAVAKMSGTPGESRATSPKPHNGGKRGRAGEDNDGNGKKKQKLDAPKKNLKRTTVSPSKLNEGDTHDERPTSISPAKPELVDSIKIQGKIKRHGQSSEGGLKASSEVEGKSGFIRPGDPSERPKSVKLGSKNSKSTSFGLR